MCINPWYVTWLTSESHCPHYFLNLFRTSPKSILVGGGGGGQNQIVKWFATLSTRPLVTGRRCHKFFGIHTYYSAHVYVPTVYYRHAQSMHQHVTHGQEKVNICSRHNEYRYPHCYCWTAVEYILFMPTDAWFLFFTSKWSTEWNLHVKVFYEGQESMEMFLISRSHVTMIVVPYVATCTSWQLQGLCDNFGIDQHGCYRVYVVLTGRLPRM